MATQVAQRIESRPKVVRRLRREEHVQIEKKRASEQDWADAQRGLDSIRKKRTAFQLANKIVSEAEERTNGDSYNKMAYAARTCSNSMPPQLEPWL